MKKYCLDLLATEKRHCLLLLVAAGIILLAALVFLAVVRKSVPVHIDAKLTRLVVKLTVSTPPGGELSLLQNLAVERIEFTHCQAIELVGKFSDLATSDPIKETKKLRLVPRHGLASITLTGAKLKLKKLVVRRPARVDVTPSTHFRIAKNSSYAYVLMDGFVEVRWKGCKAQIAEQELSEKFAEEKGGLCFQPNKASRRLIVRSTQELLNVYLKLPKGSTCTLKKDLRVAALGFLQPLHGAPGPDETTTIKEVKITLPTLSNEKPITLPEGSYLKIGNLRDFRLKHVRIDPSKAHIAAVLYGYTNDLQAAYGRGELTQLMPASLILLRQNALVVAIVVILLWYVKAAADLYDRWRVRKGGE